MSSEPGRFDSHLDGGVGTKPPTQEVRWALALPHVFLASAATFAIFATMFATWTSTSAWSFPRFLIAALLLGYLPGKVVLETIGPPANRLEHFIYSILVGLTSTGLAYWVCGFLNVRPLFFSWPALAAAVSILRARRSASRLRSWRVVVDLPDLALMGVLTLAILPFVLLPMWFSNATRQPNGVDVPVDLDLVLHLAFANELSHTIPPQVPFVAGRPLAYHYGMDVIVAMFSYAGNLSVIDLTVRFLPALYVLLAVLSSFCFGCAWLKSKYAALLMPLLVLFGEDLSYLPALFLDRSGIWSARFFQAPSTFSLYVVNSMLPGVAFLFGSLLALSKCCAPEAKRSWIAIAALLCAALSEFKVFAAAQVAAALGISAAARYAHGREKRLLNAFIAVIAVLSPILLYSWHGNSQGAKYVIRARVFDGWEQTLGWVQTLGGSWANLVQASSAARTTLLLVALPVFLVGSLGLRILGARTLFRELQSPNAGSGFRFLVSVFVALGIAMTLMLDINLENRGAYNNGVWFIVQSKYVAWIFVIECLWHLGGTSRYLRRPLLVGALLALSVPSTLQFLASEMSEPASAKVRRSGADLHSYLSQVCSDGEVLLSSARLASRVVAMTRCRVPFANIYADTVVPRAETERRLSDLKRFWESPPESQTRRQILRDYNVAYVLVRRGHASSDVAGDVAQVPLFENVDFAVFAVR